MKNVKKMILFSAVLQHNNLDEYKLRARDKVGARIPNLFGIRMVECVWFSNGVRFSNGFKQNGRHLVQILNGPDHSKSEFC